MLAANVPGSPPSNRLKEENKRWQFGSHQKATDLMGNVCHRGPDAQGGRHIPCAGFNIDIEQATRFSSSSTASKAPHAHIAPKPSSQIL